MINRVSLSNQAPKIYNLAEKKNLKNSAQSAASPVSFGANSYGADRLAAAYRGYTKSYPVASSVAFTGVGSLNGAFNELQKSLMTCKDEKTGRSGEEVAKSADVNKLVSKYIDDLPNYDDAVKTTIEINRENSDEGILITEARTQVKKGEDDNMKFEMVVRPPRKKSDPSHHTNQAQQILQFELEPFRIAFDANNRKSIKGTDENAFVLNTKGKLMAVVEDKDDVLLTSTGFIEKKNQNDNGDLRVLAKQYELKDASGKKLTPAELSEQCSTESVRAKKDSGVVQIKNQFIPFEIEEVPEVRKREGGSQGGGTELVIGLEDGRFVPEIIASIEEFVQKVQDGEIVLDEFVPAENAKDIQISMLAGGFGSRAEYANASSSKIMHGNPDGSNSTKGCFRTATGLTPMETTFISLHMAGLLDCSKENLGINKNIKFYLNDSGENSGNGGFTVNMYDKMAREGRECTMIFPNDAMSRNPRAISEAADLINSKKAAVVMIAKEVKKETAAGSLGIMQIADNGEILAFAEKPKEVEDSYTDGHGNCFANTFQFAVSKEAFEALSLLEESLPDKDAAKESRDWSKVLTPVLMAITQNDDTKVMQEKIDDAMEAKFHDKKGPKIDEDTLRKAKEILGDQKIYAVKTDEPWADCGTLNALYYTTMQIVKNDFPLEDFERKHAIDSVNTQTGLIATTPEQKARIEDKYDIKGQIMAAPKAKVVNESIVDKYSDAITKYSDTI